MIQKLAQDDFERAASRGFWRSILKRIMGEENTLLPFDEVRERLPIQGQHYLGLRQVEIDLIVGSMGRYHDFDRAFLPLQRRTRDRWISIDKAHYEDVPLPPVELFKIGEIYFVKDGNHRVSVAHERGQLYIDAYVTEIDIPVRLTPDTRVNDLTLKQAYGDFMAQTCFNILRPGVEIEASSPEFYPKLLEHIEKHRWYLGEKRQAEASYEEAVISWYEQVYLPLAQVIQEQNIMKQFPGSKEADLCLWLMEYQAYLRQATQMGDEDIVDSAQAAQQLLMDYSQPAVRELVSALSRTNWLDEIILAQEKVDFLEKTGLAKIRPEAQIETTLSGQYARLREHIAVHRWYLGEQRKAPVANEDAVASWYDQVYLPVVQVIREQGVIKEFPRRTETDLYLWIVTHQWYLRELYGQDVPLETAAEDFADDYSERPMKKVVKAIKKVTGME